VAVGAGAAGGGAGAGGAEEGAAGGVTATAGEMGFVELGLGVQASSSNPTGFAASAAAGVDPVSIRLGEGVLLLCVADIGVPN
jgi:hypothetical protein